jgi:hypothetical protein
MIDEGDTKLDRLPNKLLPLWEIIPVAMNSTVFYFEFAITLRMTGR